MSTPAEIAWDLHQWRALIEPIIGTTDVLTYPFGARPDGGAVRRLGQAGYRIQCDIDTVARTTYMNGAIVMSRRHVDGCGVSGRCAHALIREWSVSPSGLPPAYW